MEPETPTEQLATLAEATLAGLEGAWSEDAVTPGALQLALEAVGDLMRLARPVPPPWMARLGAVSETAMAEAFSPYRAEVATWAVPEGGLHVPLDGGDAEEQARLGLPHVALALQRRDLLASALTALTRICLGRGRAPASIAGLADLLADVGKWEEALDADRESVEALLELRAALPASWTARFPARQVEQADAPEAFEDVRIEGLGEPDDATLDAYARRGALHRYVEGYAAQHADFAEDLEALLLTLQEAGELGAALAPRRFLRQRVGARVVRLPSGPRRLAAASGGEAETHELDLGALPGLHVDAEASLTLAAGKVTVRVESDADLTVTLGDVSTADRDVDRSYFVTAPWRDGGLRLEVRDGRGGAFEEILQLDSGAEA